MQVTNPLDSKPAGFRIYTPDGFVSAQLMKAGRSAFQHETPVSLSNSVPSTQRRTEFSDNSAQRHCTHSLDSRVQDSYSCGWMMCKRLFLILAAGALLFLQFGDCISVARRDRQTMNCCASMPCIPVNHGQDCCSKMTPVQRPEMLRAEYVSLRGPTVATVEYSLVLKIVRATPVVSLTVSAQQHSPPDLYTLNASLLI